MNIRILNQTLLNQLACDSVDFRAWRSSRGHKTDHWLDSRFSTRRILSHLLCNDLVYKPS